MENDFGVGKLHADNCNLTLALAFKTRRCAEVWSHHLWDPWDWYIFQLAFGRHGKLEGTFTYTYNIPFPWILWVVKCWAEELRRWKKQSSEIQRGIGTTTHPKWWPTLCMCIYIYICYSNDILWYDLVYKYMIINIWYDIIFILCMS